jgi:hypothetical protein
MRRAGGAGSPCELEATCGRAALTVRLANILAARVHTAARPCGNGRTRVRQNRVVLAVVATVKPFAEVSASPTGRTASSIRGRGRPEGIRLPGEHGISRQPIAQGRPSDWLHLYAAVRSFCVCFSRSRPWVPAGTRPSLRPLGQEGGEIKQSSGEMRREGAKACLRIEMRVGDGDATPSSVIASAAKQSRVFPRRDSGLLRRKGSSQ